MNTTSFGPRKESLIIIFHNAMDYRQVICFTVAFEIFHIFYLLYDPFDDTFSQEHGLDLSYM